MNTEALSLSNKLLHTMMSKFSAEDLPPKGHWHYHQGVFLLGLYKIYELTNNETYYEYMKSYVDSLMANDGSIWYSCMFDNAMPCVLLFPLHQKTGDDRYRVTLDGCMSWIPRYFKTESGGFWHGHCFENQMWLDGFYMAQPLCVQYASVYNTHPEFYEMAYTQLKLMRQFTRDEKTGLWHHAYDESKKAAWADKNTGKSPEFWGRSFGWIGAAIVDILDYMPLDCTYRDFFIDVLKEYVQTIVKYQDKDNGLWYQILDKGERSDNWTETSCSCLFIYTLCKGMRNGYLDKSYLDNIQRGYEGIKTKLMVTDTDVIINDICVGTGVGKYEYYVNRPKTQNDLHGAGAFLLAMSEIIKVL